MRHPIYQVDAFTDQPFRGNPAAVCVLAAPIDADWMQSVASEMNLAETAFVQPHPDGFLLRWFTPAVEVDLCGHATLAAAHVLWQAGYQAATAPIRFHTRSGLLTAQRHGDLIHMDFPSVPAIRVDPPEGLIEALNVQPIATSRNKFDYLLEIASEQELRRLKPDMVRLVSIPCRGVIVTSASDSPEFDFVSRFFAPAVSVPEDPVTGSAHCALGPYWQQKLGRNSLVGYQASARGGVVRVEVHGDRIHLAGNAVTVLTGELV